MRMGIKIYVLITFLFSVGTMAAGSMAPFQSQDVITNFFLNEDDTTRYIHHYLYEQAYQTIEDMLVGRRTISLKDAEFAIENAFLEGGGFVFGMGDGLIYFYNSNGVQATCPMKYFVNPKR